MQNRVHNIHLPSLSMGDEFIFGWNLNDPPTFNNNQFNAHQAELISLIGMSFNSTLFC